MSWRPLAAKVIKALNPSSYDVYIHYRSGVYVGNRFSCGLKLLVLSGKRNDELEANFDYVLSQSPGGTDFLADMSKEVILPPPTQPISRCPKPVLNLPQEFLLTVFNPYHPMKSHDDLYEVAAAAPYPIVWSHGERSVQIADNIRRHPNIIHIADPSQDQLRYLYESCRAYVSFSRSEGDGWSIADALLYDVPIVSREVDVLHSFQGHPGIELYSTTAELPSILKADTYLRTTYDTSVISPSRFRRSLVDLVKQHDGRMVV